MYFFNVNWFYNKINTILFKSYILAGGELNLHLASSLVLFASKDGISIVGLVVVVVPRELVIVSGANVVVLSIDFFFNCLVDPKDCFFFFLLILRN